MSSVTINCYVVAIQVV